jgi:probable addiction module antidote protein
MGNFMSKKKIEKLTGSYEEWLIESLRDQEEATAFLQAAFEEFQKDGDTEALLLSLRHVAEAQGGMSRLARTTRLNRESLYKTLSKRGNPKLQTVGTLLKGLGFQLSVKPVHKKAS